MPLAKAQRSGPSPPAEAADKAAGARESTASNPIWQRLACGVMPKLAVGAPDDPYEREADRVADHVMRMPAPGADRACTSCASEQPTRSTEEPRIQRQPVTAATPIALPGTLHAAQGAGRPLDAAVQAFAEPRFDRDFSAVRVHDDPRARMRAASLGARAFTYGTHIWLGHNESAGDLRLMAHELTHVIQQTTASRASREADAGLEPRGQTDAAAVATERSTPSPLIQRAPISKDLRKRIELCVNPFYYDEKGSYRWSLDPKPDCSDMSVPADRKRAWKCVDRFYWSPDGKKWTWSLDPEPDCSDLRLPVPLADARAASAEELASIAEGERRAAEAAKHAGVVAKNRARIEEIRKAAPTDVEALARLFTDPKIDDGGTLVGRVNAIFEATEHEWIPALQTGVEFGQTGFRKEYLDPWPSSENQVGHFLTAVRMAFDPGVVTGNLMLLAILDAWTDSEMPLRLIIGHEKEPDPYFYEVPGGFIKQYRATTEEDIKNFKAGKLDAIKVGKGRGNSMADLALSYKGWILGRWIAENRFKSGAEIATWIRNTLAAGTK